jgi:signal transduction histidine kinase
MELARWGRQDRDLVTLWLPVVGVAAASQAGLGLEEPWSGSDAGLAVVALLQAGPLALRRRWPVVSAALVAATLPLQEALGGSLSFGTFVAVLVVAYSLGRYAATAGSQAAGTVLVLSGVVLGTLESVAAAPTDLVFPVFYVSAALAVGAVVRRLVSQAAELRELNSVLERERDATVRLAVAGERLRLSRELHDSVAHTLTVAVVQAERCEQALADDPGSASEAVRAIQAAGRRGLSELRSVLRLLRDPDTPVRDPGLADLGALVAAMSGPDLQVALTWDGEPARVADEVGLQLFRVTQESLTNVVRHSDASAAAVRLSVGPDSVTVEVTDPGPSRTSALPCGGHGLAVMAERMAGVGGSVVAGHDGDGFRVAASAPLTGEVAR